MKILAFYGHHIEERAWGEKVCDEYVQRYSPSEDSFLAIPIEKPVRADEYWWGNDHIDIYQEIGNKIKQHKPNVSIDIHHSRGTHNVKGLTPLEISYRNSEVDRKFASFLAHTVPKGIKIKPRHSEDSFLFFAGLSVPALDVANFSRVRYLVSEANLYGSDWRFPNNPYNQQIFNDLINFIALVQKYK